MWVHALAYASGSHVLPIVWAFVLLFVSTPASAAPATKPTSASPSTTPAADSIENILTEIRNAPPGQPRDAESQARLSAPRGGDDDPRPKTAADWWRLICLMGPSLFTAGAVAVAASVLGVFVILRREALLALALPQVVAIGVAAAMRLGWPTLPPALVAAVAALLILALAQRRGAQHWILPSLYISGLCASFLIIANHGQDVGDLQHLLTGGVDVAVSKERAAIATPLLVLAGIVTALLWRRWLLLSQAPAAAELAGLRPALWNANFLALLGFVVLLGTDSLGVVMVLAMLFLPAAAVLPWVQRVPNALAASCVLALLFLAAGFWLSNVMFWPMSQSVGGVGFAAMAASNLVASFKRPS